MSQPIRFGFLGAGQIAYPSAASIQRHPHATLVAAQDLHPGRLSELCEKERIPKAYDTAEALLADPEVDAVYIAVPNRFHAPLAIRALEAGKHVILEKPFALSLAEAQAAAEAARKAGKVLTLGMNQRFDATHQRVKALVEAGALGEIYHAKAYWLRRTGIPKLGTWFCSRELAGGGALYDIGVHVLDLCLYLVDNFEPISVSGATYTKFGNRGLGEGGWGKSDKADLPFDVDDFATGFLRFANGLTVSLETSWARHAARASEWDVELFGTEGGATAVSGQHFAAGPGGYTVTEALTNEPRFAHKDRFHNFINHLRGEEPLCVTLEQALAVQRILDGLAESAATGCEVRL